jgi:hypothetical protein
MFLDFVHRIIFHKNTFRKMNLFPSSGKIMSESQSLVQGPNRVGTAIILPEDGNRSSFRKVAFLKKL